MIDIRVVGQDKVLLEKCYEIRRRVFVEEQKVNREEEYDNYEWLSHHYLAFWSKEAVGTCRWRKTEKGYKLERFAVLIAYRKKNIGKKLLASVLQNIEKEPQLTKFIYLHAQLPVLPFYAKQGFIKKGDVFYEARIPHYFMYKIV